MTAFAYPRRPRASLGASRPAGPRRPGRPVSPGSPTSVGPLCVKDRIAAFEIVVMMRCTVPIAARRRITSTQSGNLMTPDSNGILNEFNQAPAAYRLVRLLAALDIEARVDRHFAGGRHRFEVYRVILAPGSGDTLRAILDEAWRTGYLLLCRSSDRAMARWQQRDRRTLAVAAWRAALLSAGRRRSSGLALRLADPDTTSVLVNAARTMGVHTRAQTRPGYQLLSVNPDSQYEQLLAVASGTETLEDAV